MNDRLVADEDFDEEIAENVTAGPEGETQSALLVQAGGRTCALPLASVRETSRPLPTKPVDGAPPFVLGVTILRGSPTPVVDLGLLLGTPVDEHASKIGRFVSLRVGDRLVALAVESVTGIRALDWSVLGALPPLLGGVPNAAIASLGALDLQLLVVLRASWTLPDAVWETLAARGEAS